jgi:predicted  nucleic acid-binding Zn-ribbon protein
MAELDVGGVKVKGGRGLGLLMAAGTLIGALYGGFEIYKDYTDMKAKLANLDTDAIEAKNAVLETKLEEAIDYVQDIKDDLRSDVIAVEKALGDVEQRIRLVEGENRKSIQEAKKWFDERTAKVDEKLNALEERLNKRLRDALQNPLLKDMSK